MAQDEHDMTDPHGEAEALRKENADLRRTIQNLRQIERNVQVERERQFQRAEAAEAALAAVTADRDKWSAENAENLRKLVAASRAPDPVVNAGSCQPGDHDCCDHCGMPFGDPEDDPDCVVQDAVAFMWCETCAEAHGDEE